MGHHLIHRQDHQDQDGAAWPEEMELFRIQTEVEMEIGFSFILMFDRMTTKLGQ